MAVSIPSVIEAKNFVGISAIDAFVGEATPCYRDPKGKALSSPDDGLDDMCKLAWPAKNLALDYLVTADSASQDNFTIDFRLSGLDPNAYVTVESPPGEFRGNVSVMDSFSSNFMDSSEKEVVRSVGPIPVGPDKQLIRLIFHGATQVKYLDFHHYFDDVSDPDHPVQWNSADMTNFESYPDPLSEECLKYNGCTWEGYFAAFEEKQTEGWVKAHNIAAVLSKDFDRYKLKTLRIKNGSQYIDAKVVDMCADSDCEGCCTENSKNTGFLIDLEKYTRDRFGVEDGTVQWRCLDCSEDASN